MSTLEDRFWAKVNRVDASCWDWLASRTPKGYGHLSVNGRLVSAHRAVWILCRGPIPEGFEIDHICRNRGCVRPEHLQVVPPGFNVRQGVEEHVRRKRAQTHCIHGHPLDSENTYVTKDKRRKCRTCVKLMMRRLRAKKLAQ